MNTSNSKGETTKEIPKHIQDWIDEWAGKQHELAIGSQHFKKTCKEIFETAAKKFYHHLTTSSPSNSGGKSAEDVFNELNKIRDVSFNEPQLDLLFEVAHTYASQFPQPQLVRTKEEIVKILQDLISLAMDGYQRHVSNACHEEFLQEDRSVLTKARQYVDELKYATQFHPTQPELKVKEDLEELTKMLREKKEGDLIAGEHHPTQEIEGEKVYRWVKASERLPEMGKPLKLKLDQDELEGFFYRDGHGDCYFGFLSICRRFYERSWDRIEWREEIPL